MRTRDPVVQLCGNSYPPTSVANAALHYSFDIQFFGNLWYGLFGIYILLDRCPCNDTEGTQFHQVVEDLLVNTGSVIGIVRDPGCHS